MRLLFRAGLVLGLATAACGKDAVGPKSLANPQATTAQMAALDTMFDISVLNSFSVMSSDIAPVAPARMATLRALAAAGNPLSRSSALRPYAKGVETSRMISQLVPAMLNASSAGLFPPDVVGKTFEWNITTDLYEQTSRAGAPTGGVRFILYAIDPFTYLPAEPLVEVGYADLDDASTSSVAKLHVTVAGVGGSPVYVDYTVSVEQTSASSARIAIAGYITKGGPDVLDFSGTINASASQTSAIVTQEVKLDVNSRDLHIRLWEKITLTQTTITLRVHFSFKHGTETVVLEGKFELNGVEETATGTVTVKVDGGLFATCTFNASASSYLQSCQGADADGLNADELEALENMGNGIGHVAEVMGGILSPPLNVLGAAF
jgi:hypothetical protein